MSEIIQKISGGDCSDINLVDENGLLQSDTEVKSTLYGAEAEVEGTIHPSK